MIGSGGGGGGARTDAGDKCEHTGHQCGGPSSDGDCHPAPGEPEHAVTAGNVRTVFNVSALPRAVNAINDGITSSPMTSMTTANGHWVSALYTDAPISPRPADRKPGAPAYRPIPTVCPASPGVALDTRVRPAVDAAAMTSSSGAAGRPSPSGPPAGAYPAALQAGRGGTAGLARIPRTGVGSADTPLRSGPRRPRFCRAQQRFRLHATSRRRPQLALTPDARFGRHRL